MSSLDSIIQVLRGSRRDLDGVYLVPGLWVDFQSTSAVAVNPYDFYAEKIESILSTQPIPLVNGEGGGNWTRRARVYNLFPRTTTAFDHRDDGSISIEASDDGWRDTGTMLKCIALLPYIQNMGINTVHLLPITSVGQDGKKGTLGSPYGIRNAYRLDENLCEPALGLTSEDLFAGFVEAAHRLGIRVVMEFVLRTASKDADWIGEHPEWFYWIREDIADRAAGSTDPHLYGMPQFLPSEAAEINEQVFRQEYDSLIPPPLTHQEMFTRPPRAEQVHKEGGRWIGVLDDGTRVRIPGAFTDWPVDDNQPPWSDVTYLRMYDHPDFNYMAYNTLRMYDGRLASEENVVQDLWDAVAGVIPHYQVNFGIDGVMVDMGHALPAQLKQRIVRTAREINPDFAFWDENFMISPGSVDEGYNAVMGYLVFDLHAGDRLRGFLNWLAHEKMPIPFFATPENHNTPRAYTRPFPLEYVHYALALSVMLPGVPFIHSGFELMETKPINTGLGFTDEMIFQNPAETLPLFSAWAFDWTRTDNLVGSVRYAMQLRRTYEELLIDSDPHTFVMGYSENPAIICFARQSEDKCLLVVASSSMGTVEVARVHFPVKSHAFRPLWGANSTDHGNETIHLDVTMGNGHVIIFEAGRDFPLLAR